MMVSSVMRMIDGDEADEIAEAVAEFARPGRLR